MNAFITGSYAYGEPRPDSDLDLVVLCESPTANTLRESGGGVPTRYGMLNLIVCEDEDQFERWKRGTETLMERSYTEKRTIGRDEAVQYFKSIGTHDNNYTGEV